MTPEQMDRYLSACHAQQSAVAFLIELGDTCATPKHLRVGVNNALADVGALAKLLIGKGFFTQEEYADAVVDAAEAEAEQWAKLARQRAGNPNLRFA